MNDTPQIPPGYGNSGKGLILPTFKRNSSSIIAIMFRFSMNWDIVRDGYRMELKL